MAIIVTVTVRPNARTAAVVQIYHTEYKAYVTPVPEWGKANQALIELLAEHFGVAKSAIAIVRGRGGTKKVIRIG
jgi:uncharacterized protein YggU (UPF0235/DUF167 family)